jgi:hypothetical protein
MRATFDDPNLVSCAGLVPVMRLARSVGLHAAVTARVHLPGHTGSNPVGKVATIVAGMLAGADNIDDPNIARHGGMPSLFTSVYAPSTLGSFLRTTRDAVTGAATACAVTAMTPGTGFEPQPSTEVRAQPTRSTCCVLDRADLERTSVLIARRYDAHQAEISSR